MKNSPSTFYLPRIVACILIMSLIGVVCADNTTIMPALRLQFLYRRLPRSRPATRLSLTGYRHGPGTIPTIVEEVPVSPSPTPTEEIVAGDPDLTPTPAEPGDTPIPQEETQVQESTIPQSRRREFPRA